METLLIVNSGSSSVKFQVFVVEAAGGLTRLLGGQVDGIGSSPRLRATAADGTTMVDRTIGAKDVPDEAFKTIKEVADNGGTLRSISFATAGNGWVLLFDECGVYMGNAPEDLGKAPAWNCGVGGVRSLGTKNRKARS